MIHVVGKRHVAFAASQTPRFPEDALGQTARCAEFLLRRRGSRFGRSEPPEHFGEGESCGIGHTLFFRAVFAQVHLLQFTLEDLGEKHGGLILLAEVALHNSGNFRKPQHSGKTRQIEEEIIVTLGNSKRSLGAMSENITSPEPAQFHLLSPASESLPAAFSNFKCKIARFSVILDNFLLLIFNAA